MESGVTDMKVEIWQNGVLRYVPNPARLRALGGAVAYAKSYNSLVRGFEGYHAVVVSRVF
jgi:hypothetical protein